MNKIILVLFSILILFFQTQSFSEEKLIFGKAKVTDGDTIKIHGEKIRLHGIDAPEIKQVCYDKDNKPYPCGVVAKDFLDNYIFHSGLKDIKKDPFSKTNGMVYCYYSERDRYKRIIGKCYVGKDSEFNLNHEMVISGQAVAYTKYSKDYIEAENTAKAKGRGIWQGKFDLPEEWRRKNK